MGLFSPSPQQSVSTGGSSTNYIPDQNVVNEWNNITGTAGGLAQAAINNYLYPGQLVADPTGLMNSYFNQAGAVGGGAPNVSNTVNNLTAYSGDMYNQQVSPSGINLPQFNASSFAPSPLSLPQFGATPNVTAPTGPSGLASYYQVNPQQVSAGQVSAPQAYTPQQVSAMSVGPTGTVNPITGVPNVNTNFGINSFQMAGPQQVQGPNLQNYTMQAAPSVQAQNVQTAGNVGPTGLASTQSWTDPGTAAQYMSPYTQNVVNTQLAQAQTQEQQQLQQQGAQAAQAGAFGGSRSAVEAANTSIGYQQLAANLQAQGLQSAYQQGQQQFNTQQGLGLQAQQFNLGQGMQAQLANQQVQQQSALANQQAGLQAGMANQQMQQQANAQNLASYLQTQGLGAQLGMQGQLANQSAGLQTAMANQQAALQAQGLGVSTNMQGQLANQQMGYQTQLANQQAQEFGLGQSLQAQLANQQTNLQAQGMNQTAGLQAGLANMGYQMQASQLNQQSALQAALANQQAGITTGLAAQQLGFQGAQFNATQQQQAAMANQAAMMQAMGMTYQGGLQGALQTQNLGLSGAEFGGNLGLQGAAQNYQLQQAQQGLNMQAIQNTANMQAQGQNLALAGYQGQLAGLGATAAGAQTQQQMAQMQADAAYQQWQSQYQLPMQALSWQAGITAQQPLPYQMYNQYANTGTMYPSSPSIFTQGLTAGMGALGAVGAFSDIRMKEDIVPVGEVAGIPVYSYRFKGLPGRVIGPMAQEVYQRWPEAVIPGSENQPWMINPARFMARVEAHGLSKVIEMKRRVVPPSHGLGDFAMAA